MPLARGKIYIVLTLHQQNKAMNKPKNIAVRRCFGTGAAEGEEISWRALYLVGLSEQNHNNEDIEEDV